MFVLENLSQGLFETDSGNFDSGPIENIVNNFYSAANMSVCHLQVQTEIATQRISFVTGPIEKLLEEKLGKFN